MYSFDGAVQRHLLCTAVDSLTVSQRKRQNTVMQPDASVMQSIDATLFGERFSQRQIVSREHRRGETKLNLSK